jgi:hypothetical protein
MLWVVKCLDAILWVMEIKLYKMLVKIKLVLMVIQDHMN